MLKILNGKILADEICKELKSKIQKLNCVPELSIYTNADPASQVYIRNKIKRCEEVGIKVRCVKAESIVDVWSDVIDTNSPFIVQMPNPLFANEEIEDILSAYKARDADGFSPQTLYSLTTNKDLKSQHLYAPCTPKGIIRLLQYYNIPIAKQHIVVIGKSNIVGKPLSYMLQNMGATVTVCHSQTPVNTLFNICNTADIIVSAVGKMNILNGWTTNENQVLIDVGINRDENGKLCGDFGAETLKNCKAYSPVPNGIGAMTVAMLMENVYEFYENRD